MASPATFPDQVRIVEVAPRDGLQNIKQQVPTPIKIELIRRLHDCGLQAIEATSIVNAQAIPQLADCESVLSDEYIQRVMTQDIACIRLPVLTPHVKALDIALRYGVQEVAVFVSASEGFSQKNIRCSVQEGLDRSRAVATKAHSLGVNVRGYISCIFACPFDGPTPPEAVLDCAKQLFAMGCYEVSLGDTVGCGVPTDVERLLSCLTGSGIDVTKLAGHFHDTYGQALANVWAAYCYGLRVFDSSIAGLGGCPYAPGSKGNLSTEDLVYSLHQAGISTGADLAKLVNTGSWISDSLQLPTSSRAASALAIKSSKSTAPLETSIPLSLQWTRQQSQSQNGIEIFSEGANLNIVLNRPGNGNALTVDMIEILTDIFRTASSNSSISRIAITARGKYFCTGMDLGKSCSPVAKGGSVAEAQYNRLFRLFDAIDKAPQVTIAVVQGPAFGGGVGLLLCCDIRLMSSAAAIQLSEVRLGLVPATISKYVVRELGVSFARELMLSARVVESHELLRLGKVALVVKEGKDLNLALDEYLVKLRQCAPQASAMSKGLVRLLSINENHNIAQEKEIRAVFVKMMSPNSESSYGLQQFQQGTRKLNWDAQVLSKTKGVSKL